jgi:hypothetical protein
MAWCLLAGGAAYAQGGPEGSLRGFVKDEQGAMVPGALVTASSATQSRTYTAVSDGEGFYRLLNVQPGSYTVTAELEGFSKWVRDGVVMRAGLNLGLDIALPIGPMSEAINVKADTPMLDTSSAAQAVNISGDFQRSVPISARKHWAEFMNMIPGVATSTSGVYQGGFHYVHGADFESLSILIDGADMASTQQSSTLYFGVSQDSVADVQVKTGAIDASSPLGMGAAINVVTQSGTNVLKGTGSIVYQPRSWVANNVAGGTATAISVVQPDVAAGGPIARDRWWFFGSYRHIFNAAGLNRTADQLSTLKAIYPAFEPFKNETKADIYFAKTTAQLSPRHQLMAFYNYDATPADTNGNLAAVPVTKTVTGGTGVAGRLTSAWGRSFTTRIGASWNNKAFNIDAARDDVPARYVHRGAFLSSGILVGDGILATLDNSTQSSEQPYTRASLYAEATWFASGRGGSHELQFGTQLQPWLHQETQSVTVNNGFVLEEVVLRDPANPSAGFVPFHRQIYDQARFTSSEVDFSDNAVYVQDAWRPHARLTVNAGLRVDFIKRTDQVFNLVVQDSAEVGPRLGLNYMLTGDRRNVVRASWNRIHDTATINKASAGSNTVGIRNLYDTNLDGTFETELATPGGARVSPNRVIDPDYHQQYTDEWTVGYRRQLPGQTMVDASYINRTYRARTTLVDQNGIYDGGVFRGYRDESLNEIYLLTNNRWNWLDYRALELQATKQTARLQVLASYTHVWSKISGTWQPNDPASFIQPGAFENDKGIGGVYSPTSVSQDGNSLSGTHMTYDNLGFIDNVLRLSVAYHAPWDFVIGTNYTLQDGVYSGPVVTRLGSADPQFGPPTVTLSNGRVVSNPLATTIRFAYPTRGEGQLQAPVTHYWNLRVGRDFAFGARRLQLALDLFNVTNSGRPEGFLSGANQEYSPNYGKTGTIQLPRSGQLSLRMAF